MLFGGGYNISVSHNSDKVIEETVGAMRNALQLLQGYLSVQNPMKYLRGKMIQPVFQVRK